MYQQVEKPKENKSRTVVNVVAKNKRDVKQGFRFVDNRPEVGTRGSEPVSQLRPVDAKKYCKTKGITCSEKPTKEDVEKIIRLQIEAGNIATAGEIKRHYNNNLVHTEPKIEISTVDVSKQKPRSSNPLQNPVSGKQSTALENVSIHSQALPVVAGGLTQEDSAGAEPLIDHTSGRHSPSSAVKDGRENHDSPPPQCDLVKDNEELAVVTRNMGSSGESKQDGHNRSHDDEELEVVTRNMESSGESKQNGRNRSHDDAQAGSIAVRVGDTAASQGDEGILQEKQKLRAARIKMNSSVKTLVAEAKSASTGQLVGGVIGAIGTATSALSTQIAKLKQCDSETRPDYKAKFNEILRWVDTLNASTAVGHNLTSIQSLVMQNIGEVATEGVDQVVSATSSRENFEKCEDARDALSTALAIVGGVIILIGVIIILYNKYKDPTNTEQRIAAAKVKNDELPLDGSDTD